MVVASASRLKPYRATAALFLPAFLHEFLAYDRNVARSTNRELHLAPRDWPSRYGHDAAADVDDDGFVWSAVEMEHPCSLCYSWREAYRDISESIVMTVTARSTLSLAFNPASKLAGGKKLRQLHGRPCGGVRDRWSTAPTAFTRKNGICEKDG